MEFPWTCRSCNAINWVEMDALTVRPIDKLHFEYGYVCVKCERFQRIITMTPSLGEAIEKLRKTDVSHSKFEFIFKKTLKKAIGVNRGTSRYNHETSA